MPVIPVIAPVPLPCRRPVRVLAPVPPLATARSLVRLSVPIVDVDAYRFVDDGVVEKKLVGVPAVRERVPSVERPVTLSAPKFAVLAFDVVEVAVPK